MIDRNSSSPSRWDLNAEAVEAYLDAQGMPAGAERIEALKREDHLRKAADTYSYLFSCEPEPPG